MNILVLDLSIMTITRMSKGKHYEVHRLFQMSFALRNLSLQYSSSNSTSSQSTTTSAPPVQTSSADTPDKVIVIASTQSDDTAWVGENFPEYVL
jgi:hypothetical protein